MFNFVYYVSRYGVSNVESVKYKTCLVPKGCSKKEVDYKIFSPIVKHMSINVLLTIVLFKDLELEQFDVKTFSSHGNI